MRSKESKAPESVEATPRRTHRWPLWIRTLMDWLLDIAAVHSIIGALLKAIRRADTEMDIHQESGYGHVANALECLGFIAANSPDSKAREYAISACAELRFAQTDFGIAETIEDIGMASVHDAQEAMERAKGYLSSAMGGVDEHVRANGRAS